MPDTTPEITAPPAAETGPPTAEQLAMTWALLEDAINLQLGTVAKERRLWPPEPIVVEPEYEDGTNYAVMVTRSNDSFEIQAFNVSPTGVAPLARELSPDLHPDVLEATSKFVRDIGKEGAAEEMGQIIFHHYLTAPLFTVNSFGQHALMADVNKTNTILAGSLRRTLQSRLICANAVAQNYKFVRALPDGSSYSIEPYQDGNGVGFAVFRTFSDRPGVRLDTLTQEDLRDPENQGIGEQYVRGFLNFALLPQMIDQMYQEAAVLPMHLSAREQRTLLERDVAATARRTDKILRKALPHDLAKRKHWPGDLVVSVPTPPECKYEMTVRLANEKVSFEVRFVDSEGHSQRVDKVTSEVNTPEGQFRYMRFIRDFCRDEIVREHAAEAVLTGYFHHVSESPLPPEQYDNLASDMRRAHTLAREAVRNAIPRNPRGSRQVSDVEFTVTLSGRDYTVQAVEGGTFDFQIARKTADGRSVDVSRIPAGMSSGRQTMLEEFVADFSHEELRRFVADRAREAFRGVRDGLKQFPKGYAPPARSTSIFDGRVFEVGGRTVRLVVPPPQRRASRPTLSA